MATLRILIVDDEEDTVQHLSRILSRSGYEVYATAMSSHPNLL